MQTKLKLRMMAWGWVSVVALSMSLSPAYGQEHSSAAANASGQGDAAKGKEIFEGKGGCLSCHRTGSVGAVAGPNLSDVGAHLSQDAIRQIILNPPAKLSAKNQLYQVMTSDGKTIQGRLLNQDSSSLQMLSTSGELIALQRSNVREGKFIEPPRMPSFDGKLTSDEVSDLSAYLATLRVSTGR